jgi:hypothetical protein
VDIFSAGGLNRFGIEVVSSAGILGSANAGVALISAVANAAASAISVI